MRRVLHLLGTLEKAGGAQRIVLEVLRRADRTRFSQSVAVLAGRNELAQEFGAIGANVLDLRKRSLFDPIGIRAVRGLLPGADVLHCHLSRAEIVGGLAAGKVPGVKLVLHKHNDDLWWRRPHLAWIHRRLVSRAQTVVAVSDAVGRFFVALDPRVEPKLVRIYNGVDPATLRAHGASGVASSRAAMRMSLGAGEDPLLLSVGRLVRQKGFDVLVRALAEPPLRTRRLRAAIVGRGEEEETLRRLARELALEKRVELLGVRTDVPALMAAADLLVAPSRWEGFGIVVAEAMALGLPVVASRVSALPELVDDGTTGALVPHDEPAALAEAIANLLDAPDLRASMSAAAKRRADAEFTIDRTVLGWERCWE